MSRRKIHDWRAYDNAIVRCYIDGEYTLNSVAIEDPPVIWKRWI